MTELTLSIPDDKLLLLKLLAKELNFTVVKEKKTTKKLNSRQKEWVGDLKAALDETELHMQGKIKLKSAKELLDEL